MQKLGVVLFGASSYENHKELDNPRFAHSIKEVKKAIADPKVNRNRETEILDLYNKALLPSDLAIAITNFLKNEYDDFIVYYCGHGDVGRRDGDYRVFLRQSNRHLRNGTMLHVAGLIHDLQVVLDCKRAFFVIDACYSGSAISDMETMDAGGAANLIDRNLLEAIEGANGIAVLAACGKLSVALAKQEDKLTLFTGAFVRCLREGVGHKSDLSALSWLDIKDEIVRITREQLGPETPIPKLTNFSDAAIDITRVPFFNNQAYTPREHGGARSPWDIDERTSEHLYWKNITENSPLAVLEDFLARFPNGVFVHVARDLLKRRIDGSSRDEIDAYLRDHPKTSIRGALNSRLAALEWETLKSGADTEKLKEFVAKSPPREFADQARSRIAFIESEIRDAAEWWERIQASNDFGEFERFLKPHSDSAFGELARERVTQLKAGNKVASSPWAAATAHFNSGLQVARQNLRYVGLAITLLGLFAVVVIGSLRSHYITSLHVAQGDLDAAGKDVNKLQDFIFRCEATFYCTLTQEARGRFVAARAATELVEALNDAGDDVTKLRAVVDDCKKASCAVLQDASRRLAAAQAAGEAAAREARFRGDLADAGDDVAKLRTIVDDCRMASCAVLQDASRRLAAARAAAEAAAREAKFRSDLVDAGDDVTKLRTIVDDCRKASCAVLQDASRRLAAAQVAAETAAREAKFRSDLADAGDDVTRLRAIVDDCRKASCAVLQDASRRLAAAQTAAETAAREAKFRSDLANAGDDVTKLRAVVDDCRKASCAVLQDASRRLTAAQAAAETAAREAKFRSDLANAGDDVTKLRAVVDDCRKASCAVLQDASRRLTAAQAAAETAAREAKFRSDLANAGDDVTKLRAVVDDCRKASCAVLQDASRRLTAAQAAAETAAREAKFRSDLANAGDDVTKLRAIVDDCRTASCTVLQDASRRLAAAQAAAEAAAREAKFRSDLANAGDDVTKLRAIVDDCRMASCAVLQDASRRLAAAQAAAEAAAREAKFRSDLANAGDDVTKLRAIVDDCRMASCAVLQDASRRLAAAQAAAETTKERARLAQIAFATKVNYDMFGGDIVLNNGKKFFTTDSTTCLSTCRATRECLAFTYDKWNSACYLKKSLNVLELDPHSDTSIRADQTLPDVASQAAHFCRYTDSDLYGDNPQRFRSLSLQDCEQSCQPDNCVAYTFSKIDRLCSLFRTVSDRKSSIPNVNAGVRTQYSCER